MKAPFPPCLGKVVRAMLQALDTPRAREVQALIDHEEWDQLVNLEVDPAQYIDADSYYRDVASTELLKKCANLPTTIDTEAVAVEGFWYAERACHRTNLRLAKFLYNGPFEDLRDLEIARYIERVQRWLKKTLGQLPNDLEGRYGPGATFADRGQVACVVPNKMSSRPTVTQAARALHALPSYRNSALSRFVAPELPDRSDPRTIRGNAFLTVLKNAKTDRGIAKEPSENLWWQLAVGGLLRGVLHRVGLDLDNGKAIHMQVACEASKTGRSATIDLKSASDMKARRLVELLFQLVPEWYALLASLRSPLTWVPNKYLNKKKGKDGVLTDGNWVYLEKFSSMGNGFTFELETLVFLAFAVTTAEELGIPAVIGQDIYVFGDDIIVPTEMAGALISVLRYFGFEVNTKKTFVTGPFRESCGGDYFNGRAVRPHHIEEYPNDPASWISLANGIRRLGTADYSNAFDALPIQRAWFCALDNLPADIRRLRGPVQLGDLLIHDYPEKWSTKWWKGIQYFKVWKPITKGIPLKRWSPAVQLASILYGVPSTGPIPRDSVDGYRHGYVACPVTDERGLQGAAGGNLSERLFEYISGSTPRRYFEQSYVGRNNILVLGGDPPVWCSIKQSEYPKRARFTSRLPRGF